MLRRVALLSLVANLAIVVTGGAVRLTGSGLGCPTWPRCTDTSYTTTPEMGVHGLVEFGNRMLGGLVGVIAIALLVLAVRSRRLVGLATLTLAGVLGQGLLGGVTVLTGLNPWTVSAHFLLSMAVIAVGYLLWLRAGDPPGRRPPAHSGPPEPPGPVRTLAWLVTGVSAAVLVLGTVVTGSGPHAGDPGTPRMPFDLDAVAQLHADAVFLLVGLTVGLWFTVRAVGAGPAASRAAAVLVGVELAQGAIGLVQYALHLPVLAVGLHVAGACAVWLATLAIWPAVGMTRATPRAMMAACPPPLAARPDPAAPTYANT